MKNKKEQIKELYSKFKEAWKNPRKKAGIKLLSYFIFFFILILFATISNNLKTINNYDDEVVTTTTVAIDKYIDKQKSLLTNKYTISYVINVNNNEYKINGTINNNIVNGYLETINGIKKIIIKDNIYEIINEEEVLLESEINFQYINLEYIINLIKQNRALIENNVDLKIYSYDLEDNIKIIVTTNETDIKEIKIENETFNYILNFDI